MGQGYDHSEYFDYHHYNRCECHACIEDTRDQEDSGGMDEFYWHLRWDADAKMAYEFYDAHCACCPSYIQRNTIPNVDSWAPQAWMTKEQALEARIAVEKLFRDKEAS